MKDYYRANLFPNTPDILPFYLQHGGRPAFMIRAVLAATLSSVYGIYSGFELCENAALPGREEYEDSEKYQFKGRDWNAPGNIKDLITKLNAIRRDNRALHLYDNLRFLPGDNDQILWSTSIRTTSRAATWKSLSRSSAFSNAAMPTPSRTCSPANASAGADAATTSRSIRKPAPRTSSASSVD